jgi:hypothetical protein
MSQEHGQFFLCWLADSLERFGVANGSIEVGTGVAICWSIESSRASSEMDSGLAERGLGK